MANREIRDILLGRIVRLDEDHWAAAPAGTKLHFYGSREGAGDVRLYGVNHRSSCYRTEEMETAAAFEEVETVLYSMGRPVLLETLPERKACLYAPHWIAPVLLTLSQDEENLLLTAYTANSLVMGRFRSRIALWVLERRLPAGLICTGKNLKIKEKRENSNRHNKISNIVSKITSKLDSKKASEPQKKTSDSKKETSESKKKTSEPKKKKTASKKSNKKSKK
ncbi:MAG: hypothetical protein IKY08_02795 [Firmicutes bacterium]|nr:hypothetical protein [Bacillota bacterium]